MNISASNPNLEVILLIAVYSISWFLMMWLIKYLMDYLSKIPKYVLGDWLVKHERIAEFSIKVKNALLLVFGVYIACLYISTGKDDYDKFMESYRSPHQQRVEFLQSKCERIDIGYEILNSGKLTYKCPNGKEYKE